MKALADMHTAAEVSRAYLDAVRNMSWSQIQEFFDNDRELPGDSPLVAHAKACLRKLDVLDPRPKGSIRLAI